MISLEEGVLVGGVVDFSFSFLGCLRKKEVGGERGSHTVFFPLFLEGVGEIEEEGEREEFFFERVGEREGESSSKKENPIAPAALASPNLSPVLSHSASNIPLPPLERAKEAEEL